MTLDSVSAIIERSVLLDVNVPVANNTGTVYSNICPLLSVVGCGGETAILLRLITLLLCV